jgi:hypothetical protein
MRRHREASEMPSKLRRLVSRASNTRSLPSGAATVPLHRSTCGLVPSFTMSRASVRDALRLRALALQVLSGCSGRPAFPSCSDRTWNVFLRTERCALALKARLVAAGWPVPDQIEQAATRELQRVLSARGQLQRIARLVSAHGMPAIALKGGVAALVSPGPVDLTDVDVLVRAPDAERLAALLEGEGFRATGPAGTAHLAQRIAPNEVHVEVHFGLNEFELDEAIWSRARPVDRAAGLSRLGAADHLWHLLLHTVVIHSYRRGALRDVLLIAEAIGDCDAAALGTVERRVSAHPLSRQLGDQLAMARELRDGLPVEDRFQREAAANYVLRGPLRLRYSRFWMTAFLTALFAQLGGASDRRLEWATAWQRPPFPSPWGLAARLERRWPTLGRWCRTATKVARLTVARAAAWPVAAVVRYVSGGAGG